jgi:hypothetical protein
VRNCKELEGTLATVEMPTETRVKPPLLLSG